MSCTWSKSSVQLQNGFNLKNLLWYEINNGPSLETAEAVGKIQRMAMSFYDFSIIKFPIHLPFIPNSDIYILQK